MADMVIPDEGKALWLKWAVFDDGTSVEDYLVDLYSNNYTPVNGSVAASFTISTFTGYAQFPVDRGDFGAVSIVANVAQIDAAVAPNFTCTAGAAQSAYGWLMRSATTNKVLAAQRFDSVRSMAPGAVESLDPFRIKLKTFA